MLRTIESGLRRRCPDAPRAARFGAVSFVHRFGSALNAHTHLHCCVTDGVFSLDPHGTLRFHPAVDLGETTISAVQRRIRRRVLRIAVRYGALIPEVAADRSGFERLLRYCARPAFASERLCWDGCDQPVHYRLTKPLPTGQTELTLTPLKLRARDPPELETDGVGTAALAFDQSPSWDPSHHRPILATASIRPWTDHPALASLLRRGRPPAKSSQASAASVPLDQINALRRSADGSRAASLLASATLHAAQRAHPPCTSS